MVHQRMYRIKQLRRQDALDQRSRWWRDGFVCALVSALAGLILTWRLSLGSLWLVLGAAIVGGVFGAIFGDRILRFWYL